MVEIHNWHLLLYDPVYDGVAFHVFGRVCPATDVGHGSSGQAVLFIAFRYVEIHIGRAGNLDRD